MKLLFVRHGQTESNKLGRMQGQEIDESLNETGVTQAEAALLNLPEAVDAIISSRLKRAHQTAEILNKKFKKSIELSDDIKELRYGTLAGKTWKEIETEYEGRVTHKNDDTIAFDYRPYGGEWSEDFKKRIARFIDGLKQRYTHDETILVTAHGGVIDAMHTLFPQKERPVRDNGVVHEFIF